MPKNLDDYIVTKVGVTLLIHHTNDSLKIDSNASPRDSCFECRMATSSRRNLPRDIQTTVMAVTRVCKLSLV